MNAYRVHSENAVAPLTGKFYFPSNPTRVTLVVSSDASQVYFVPSVGDPGNNPIFTLSVPGVFIMSYRDFGEFIRQPIILLTPNGSITCCLEVYLL